MKFLIFIPLLLLGVCITQSVEAADLTYKTMVTLPKLSGTENTAEEYVRALYILSISVAGILAVVKIIFAGVKYMLTDVVVSKGDAKKDIMGALLGLLIVLGAVLILNTINPQITTLSLFENGPSVGIVGTKEPDPKILNTIISDPDDPRYGSVTTVSTCGTSNTISCEQANDNCLNNPGYVAVQQPGPNSITCFIDNTPIEGAEAFAEAANESEIGEAVARISQGEHQAAADDRTLSTLRQTKIAEAAEKCGVAEEQIIEEAGLGFNGITFFCPKE